MPLLREPSYEEYPGQRQLQEESRHPTGKRLFYLWKLIPYRVSVEEVMNSDLHALSKERKVRLRRLQNMREKILHEGYYVKQGAAVKEARASDGGDNEASSWYEEAASSVSSACEGTAAPRSGTMPGEEGADDSDAFSTSSTTSSVSSWGSVFDGSPADATCRRGKGPHQQQSPLCLSFLVDHHEDTDPSSCGECATATRTSPPSALLSLRLLAQVAEEKRQATDAPVDPALVNRLRWAPLPVLREVARTLTTAAQTFEARVAAPQEAATLDAAAVYVCQQRNAFLFHVALWQRRHPLSLCSFVLELYRTGQLGAFVERRGMAWPPSPVTAGGIVLPPSAIQPMNDLLEALTSARHPQLARIPWRIRVDVFMTYPLTPLAEQLAMMEEVTAYVRQRRTSGERPAGESEDDSAVPLRPRALLRGYLEESDIPDRGVQSLTDAQYRTLRAALERHKQDGVLRLCHRHYS